MLSQTWIIHYFIFFISFKMCNHNLEQLFTITLIVTGVGNKSSIGVCHSPNLASYVLEIKAHKSRFVKNFRKFPNKCYLNPRYKFKRYILTHIFNNLQHSKSFDCKDGIVQHYFYC